jgi:hypothetical protein
MKRQYQFATNSYAGDGKCHCSARGSYGHECGKPATHIGTNSNAFRTGFCAECIMAGIETGGFNFEAIKRRDTEGAFTYIETR